MRVVIILLCLVMTGCSVAQQFNVMTYNIRYDNPGDGVNQWSSRKEKVFALIKKYNPALLGVQEALYHQLEDIQRSAPHFRYVGIGRDDGKQKGEYSALFYDTTLFQAIDQNTFWLSKTPSVPGSKDWDAAITRVATWARLKHRGSGRELLVINTHFDHIGKEARKESAQILKRMAATLAPGLPTVITGDFNFTRDDDPYSVMMNGKDIKLIDTAPNNPPGTFCSFEVNSIPCRGIDYIFHSSDLKSANYQVIYDNDGKNYPSDHVPVMVTLQLK